jgi:hypothetical protein
MNYLDIAKKLRAAANAAELWMHNNFNGLSSDQREHLDALITSLRSFAANYFIKASRQDILDPAIEAHQVALGTAINSADSAIKAITGIRKVLKVVASLIGLATALGSPTPAGVLAAIGKVTTAFGATEN